MNYFIDHYNKNPKFIWELHLKNHIHRQKAENIKQKQTPKTTAHSYGKEANKNKK